MLTGKLLDEGRRLSTLALTLEAFGLLGVVLGAVEGRAAGRDVGVAFLVAAVPGLLVLGTLLLGGPVTGVPWAAA